MSIRILEYVCSFLLAFIQMRARPRKSQKDRYKFVIRDFTVYTNLPVTGEQKKIYFKQFSCLLPKGIKAGATGVAKSVLRTRWHDRWQNA